MAGRVPAAAASVRVALTGVARISASVQATLAEPSTFACAAQREGARRCPFGRAVRGVLCAVRADAGRLMFAEPSTLTPPMVARRGQFGREWPRCRRGVQLAVQRCSQASVTVPMVCVPRGGAVAMWYRSHLRWRQSPRLSVGFSAGVVLGRLAAWCRVLMYLPVLPSKTTGVLRLRDDEAPARHIAA